MYDQLTPGGLFEESFVSEITGATWHLRRCNAAEGEIGDFDETTDKTRRSIERARGAHSALQRSLNQLRKLQTERITREQLGIGNTEDAPLAEARKICEALNIHNRNQKTSQRPPATPSTSRSLPACTPPAPTSPNSNS